MASDFNGSDFYGHSRLGGESTMTNPSRFQYHPQLGGILVDPSPPKRSLTEFQRQHHHHQQQSLHLLRSVKQRTLLQSPVSPLSPIDFSTETPTNSSERLGFSVLQKQMQQTHNPKSPNFSSSAIPGRLGVSESEPEKEMMKNRLQELERHLFDDQEGEEEEEEEERDCSDVSALTASDWAENARNLITPKPHPTSPATSSSSSATATSASPSPSPVTPDSNVKQMLMDSATAISEGRMETAASTLAGVKPVSKTIAGDPQSRLAAYMVSALLSRINPAESGGVASVAGLWSAEHLAATQMLYEKSPVFNLGFLAANLAVLEAIKDHPKIHIVDFDIGDGTHYAYLIKALGERRPIKPTVKITALSDPNSINSGNSNGFQSISDRLMEVAQSAGICVKFAVLRRRGNDLLRRESIRCDPDEAVAVKFPFHLSKVADESVSPANPRDGLLRAVKGLRPDVVVVVEQDMNSNTAPFQARVGSAWAHYLALFELLDSTMTRDGSDRIRLEECLGRKAANAVAKEGMDRIERCEVFGKWSARMGMAGFESRPLGAHIADSVRHRLGTSWTQSGFFVKEEAGGICIGWMGQILTVASAWR